MAAFTPQIIPLGSLAEAAAAGADTAQQEQALYALSPSDPGTLTGARPVEPDWP